MAVKGTLTVTTRKVGTNIMKYKLAMLTESGVVTSNTFNFVGKIIGVKIYEPSASTKPTSGWDLTISTPDATDILAGFGANITNSTPVVKLPLLAQNNSQYANPYFGGITLKPALTNGGSSKEANVEIFAEVYG